MRRLEKVSVATACGRRLVADQPRHQVQLARADTQVRHDRLRLGVGQRARMAWACSSSPPRPLVAGVAGEGARRRELAELVAHHVLVHLHRQELVAVVDAEGQADELRQDGRAARPDADDLVAARGARRLPPCSADSRRRTDPSRRNAPSLLALVAAADDQSVRAACCCASCSPWSAGPMARPDAGRPNCGPRRRPADDRPGSSPRRGCAAACPASACDRPCRSSGSCCPGSTPRRSRPCTRRARCAVRPSHQLDLRPAGILADKLRIGARGARDLAAGARPSSRCCG